ncbi:MAG TPA: hypothetical protein VHQ94_10370 [Pyrinomonadaceae bacterium]|jgi:tetratricopeptide (TPR) repeat protein|nr:hypothetical protein [Pyrinomonadaceae bacterium]
MKKMMMLLTTGATVALLALPVAANTSVVATANAAQDACAPEARDVLYKTFTDNRQADQAKAYDAAKKYLACPVATPTEAQTKIIEYLTRWVGLYEKGKRKQTFTDELYNKKNYTEAFKLGGEILKDQPDDTKVMLDLGANGYLVASLNNAQLTAEAVDYARKAIAALEGGKTVEDWTGLQNKDVALAYANYTVGSLTIEKDPAGALKYLIKAAQYETPLKKSPVTYALIAGAYETGPYAKLSQEYTEKYKGKDETPESKLALANIHQIVDRMIDGYARAVALAGSDAKVAAQKTVWNDSLKQWFKFRNPDMPETGVDAVVAGILAKPLPPEPTPLVSLPATPAATTTGTSGSATPTTTGTGNGAGNGATAPAKPAASPAATPAAANTKPAATKPGGPNKPR